MNPPTRTRSAQAVAQALAVLSLPKVCPQVAFEANLPGVTFVQLFRFLVSLQAPLEFATTE